MIRLLSKIFIENRNLDEPHKRSAYGMLCGIVGIILNFILFDIKLIAGILSSSVSITADAFNNLSDSASSVVSLVGFKMASGKADAEHPYGHGRIEYISGLIVAFLIMIMAVELIKSSFEKIIHPVETELNLLICMILIISILVKLYMIHYNRAIGIRIGSPSMKATAADSAGDVCSTSVVLMCSVFSHFTGINIDGYCGLAVGLFILYSGFVTARDASSPLLGSSPSPEYLKKIHDIVLSYPEVYRLHDLRVHDYGPGHTMISLHAEVSALNNLVSIHDVIDDIEDRLADELGCEAVIHIDPIIHDADTDYIRNRLNMILRSIGPELSFHDLHIKRIPDEKPIIYFDLLLPMDYPKSDDEVIGFVLKELNIVLGESFSPVIKIERDYAG